MYCLAKWMIGVEGNTGFELNVVLRNKNTCNLSFLTGGPNLVLYRKSEDILKQKRKTVQKNKTCFNHRTKNFTKMAKSTRKSTIPLGKEESSGKQLSDHKASKKANGMGTRR